MFRKEAGLEQQELGQLLGYTDGSSVARHEAAQRVPTLELALLYAAALGVCVEELFLGRYETAREEVKARAWELLLMLRRESPERHRAISSLESFVDDPDVCLEPCEEN